MRVVEKTRSQNSESKIFLVGIMEKSNKIKQASLNNDHSQILDLLHSGLDPNFGGGWPIRLAARCGSFAVVQALLQFGANPHLLGESGASTLQLAVYSGKHWESNTWKFLLSCCDSSQLADGAAVAIVFKNIFALKKIIETGRCNTNIPTSLTGKTVEQLAKGYKMQYVLTCPSMTSETIHNISPGSSPTMSRQTRSESFNTLTPPPHSSQRTLSPSVARFFEQTSAQASLTPNRSTLSLSPFSRANY